MGQRPGQVDQARFACTVGNAAAWHTQACDGGRTDDGTFC